MKTCEGMLAALMSSQSSSGHDQHSYLLYTCHDFTDCVVSLFLFDFLFFIFLNYESITHLQETWKIQKKVTCSSTIYYNCFLNR